MISGSPSVKRTDRELLRSQRGRSVFQISVKRIPLLAGRGRRAHGSSQSPRAGAPSPLLPLESRFLSRSKEEARLIIAGGDAPSALGASGLKAKTRWHAMHCT